MNAKKILVVEDDAFIAESLQTVLKALGYNAVGIAFSGTEAIEKAELLKPDLILMDIVLKDQVSGIEAAEVIRLKQQIPVVYLTASTDPANIDSAKLTSPFGYVVKPYNETELQASIEIALQKSALENKIEHLNKILRATRDVSRHISQEFDNDKLMNKICKSLTDKSVFDFCWILILDEEKNPEKHFSCGDELGSKQLNDTFNEGKIPGCVEKAVRSLETCIVTESKQYCENCNLKDFENGKYEIIAPLIFKETFYGVLVVSSYTSDQPADEEISLIEDVGSDIAFALSRSELERAKDEFSDALSRSEQRFRNLIEISNDAIYLTHNGKFEIINKRFTELFGYTVEEIKFEGIVFMDLVAPQCRHIIEERERKLKEGRHLDSLFEFTALTKNGSEVECEISVAYLQYEKSTAIHGIIRDVTGRKLMEKALVEAKDIAEKSDKLKSEFLAQISHEIRTPINSIINFSDLIKENINVGLDKDLKTGLEIIRSSGNRIARTIDLILNMAELQVGTYNFAPKKLSLLDDVLVDLYKEFKNQAAEKGIKIEIECSSDSANILADKYAVNQIFTNLLDNAVKYTFNGNIRIVISKDEMGRICGEISDTGIGITPDYLPILFDPFTQEEQGYTRKFEGNGLGLALVKKYCDMNNATITVKSEKGIGSSFKVTFPNYTVQEVLSN